MQSSHSKWGYLLNRLQGVNSKTTHTVQKVTVITFNFFLVINNDDNDDNVTVATGTSVAQVIVSILTCTLNALAVTLEQRPRGITIAITFPGTNVIGIVTFPAKVA